MDGPLAKPLLCIDLELTSSEIRDVMGNPRTCRVKIMHRQIALCQIGRSVNSSRKRMCTKLGGERGRHCHICHCRLTLISSQLEDQNRVLLCVSRALHIFHSIN